jgi:tRNA threonylcarbamoyladenosine biosynthesis protein TsaB
MILTLDTSGSRCGVALWADGLLGYTETLDNLRHNEVLFDRLGDLMDRHHAALSDLTAVAVSSGPGSFTGLRVGMAAAKGLCWSLKLPLIAVPTLEGWAASVPPRLERVVPLMPARAREIYWCRFEHDGVSWNQIGDYSVSEVGTLQTLVDGVVYLCGEGYDRHKAELDESFADRRLTLTESEFLEPLVVSTARLAAERFAVGRFDDLMKTEPEYFYPFPRNKT